MKASSAITHQNDAKFLDTEVYCFGRVQVGISQSGTSEFKYSSSVPCYTGAWQQDAKYMQSTQRPLNLNGSSFLYLITIQNTKMFH